MSIPSEVRAGARAIAPMLVGVVPFGLVAGATPVSGGLGGGAALGLSTFVFAGASQLATADALAQGSSAMVAVLAAWTVNLRMVLYSASLAPHLAREPVRRRLLASYLLTDQAYALSVTRWGEGDDPEKRLPFYLGASCTLWASWQASTLLGILVGGAVPDDLPLDFAVPLVFLVLLIPVLTSRPAVAAATAGGIGAVVAAQMGAGHLSVMAGAFTGIVAGVAAEVAAERRARPARQPGAGAG